MFKIQVFAAVIATFLAIFGINELAHVLVHGHQPHEPGFAVATEEDAGKSAETKAVVKEESLAELLSHADAAKGEKVSKKCAACHTFAKGDPNKVGPNLWNIVDRPSAGVADFKYSTAMHDSGITWTYENLFHFLKSPKDMVKGTAMSFAGLPKAGDRANLLAYLHTLSDNPVPFPAVEAPAPAAVANDATEAAGQAMGDAKDTVQQAAGDMMDKAKDAASDAADAAKKAVQPEGGH